MEKGWGGGWEGMGDNYRVWLPQGSPGGSDSEESACNAGDPPRFDPWIGKFLWRSYPLQYSCLENPMDRGDWQVTFSSVQSLSHVQLFATTWTAACQASLSITNSRSLLKLTFIQLVMPSNHHILCHPLLFFPSIFPSIRVFSSESALRIRYIGV